MRAASGAAARARRAAGATLLATLATFAAATHRGCLHAVDASLFWDDLEFRVQWDPLDPACGRGAAVNGTLWFFLDSQSPVDRTASLPNSAATLARARLDRVVEVRLSEAALQPGGLAACTDCAVHMWEFEAGRWRPTTFASEVVRCGDPSRDEDGPCDGDTFLLRVDNNLVRVMYGNESVRVAAALVLYEAGATHAGDDWGREVADEVLDPDAFTSLAVAASHRATNTYVEIAAGSGSFTCALTELGGLRCFGDGVYGQMGRGSTDNIGDDELPVAFPPMQFRHPIRSVAGGMYHMCVVLVDGALQCWGYNYDGQLGLGHGDTIGDDERAEDAPPSAVGGPVRLVDLGSSHTCVSMDTPAQNIRCFGRNWEGRLGLGHGDNIGDDERPDSQPFLNLGVNTSALTILRAGYDHSCALINGSVWCWGQGTYGQLGYGNTDTIGDDEIPGDVLTGPVDVGGEVTDMDAGERHTCVVLAASGRVRCWGNNVNGELGIGSTTLIGDDEVPAMAPFVLVDGVVSRISIGAAHTCAVRTDHTLVCWGFNAEGELGHGTTVNIGDNEAPALFGAVPIGGQVTSVACGAYHTCVLIERGVIRCFGYGGDGQLGTGSRTSFGDNDFPSNSPLEIPAVRNVAILTRTRSAAASLRVAMGYFHSCVMLEEETVRCWGLGSNGQIGQGTRSTIGDDELPSSVPVVNVGSRVRSVSAGGFHTCVVLEDGAVRCFGANSYGQLGLGHTDSIGDDEGLTDAASLVPLAGPARSVGCGGYSTCFLLDDDRVTCVGYNGDGELGLNTTDGVGDDEPVGAYGYVALSGSVVRHMAYGGYHACVVIDDGQVQCFGYGLEGALGYGSSDNIGDDDTPADWGVLGFNETALETSLGLVHSCVLFETGQIRCFGLGVLGRLGSGSVDTLGDDEPASSLPFVELPEPSFVRAVSAGVTHTCVLLVDWRVVCFGGNSEGQLGIGSADSIGDDETPAAANRPVELGGANVLQVSSGGWHTCVLLEDRNVRCFGDASEGQIGYGSTVDVGGAGAALPRDAGHVSLAAASSRWVLSDPNATLFLPREEVGGTLTIESLDLSRATALRLVPNTDEWVGLRPEARVRSTDKILASLAGNQCPGRPGPFGTVLACTYSPSDPVFHRREPFARLYRAEAETSAAIAIDVAGADVEGAPASTDDTAEPSAARQVAGPAELSTAGGTTVVLYGTFGWIVAADVIPTVTVDGRPCANAFFRNLTTLACTAPPGSGRDVDVSFAVTTPWFSFNATLSGALSFAAPRIDTVEGPTSGQLDPFEPTPIRVTGVNLGNALAVPHVRVGSLECTNVTVESSAVVHCLAPPQFGDPVALVVELDGQASVPADVSYARPKIPPVRAPSRLRGYRRRGDDRTLWLEFEFPTRAEELADPANPVPGDEFEVEGEQAGRFFTVGSVQRSIACSEQQGTRACALVVALPSGELYPVRVRVAARNTYGLGLLSAPSGLILPNCTRDSYLARTSNDTRPALASDVREEDDSVWPEAWLQRCMSCTPGALCCGMRETMVRPQSGYWRVFWVTERPAFSACPNSDACVGLPSVSALSADGSLEEACQLLERYDLFSGNASTQSSGSVEPVGRDERVFLPSVAQDGCAEGYTGVQCDLCAVGFYRTSTDVCLPCGDKSTLALRLLGIAVLGALLLGFFLVRSYRNAGSGSSITVQLVKQLVTHFQMLAIVTNIQLRWPAFLSTVLETSDNTSSLSVEGLSIECALGSEIQNPYARTLFVISTFLWMLLFAIVVWTTGVFLVTGELCRIWRIRATRGSRHTGRIVVQHRSAEEASGRLPGAADAPLVAPSATPYPVTEGAGAPPTPATTTTTMVMMPGPRAADEAPNRTALSAHTSGSPPGGKSTVVVRDRRRAEADAVRSFHSHSHSDGGSSLGTAERPRSPRGLANKVVALEGAAGDRGSPDTTRTALAAQGSDSEPRAAGPGRPSSLPPLGPARTPSRERAPPAGLTPLVSPPPVSRIESPSTPIRALPAGVVAGPRAPAFTDIRHEISVASLSDNLPAVPGATRAHGTDANRGGAGAGAGRGAGAGVGVGAAAGVGVGVGASGGVIDPRDPRGSLADLRVGPPVGGVLGIVKLVEKVVLGVPPFVDSLRSPEEQWVARMEVSVLVVSFVTLPMVTRAALRLLVCTDVYPEGVLPTAGETRSWMSLNPTKDCDDPSNWSYALAVALPALLLFTLGVPVVAAWVLVRRRPHFEEADVRQRLGFLYVGYHRAYYFWEVVVMVRKLGIAVLLVVLENQGVLSQIAGATFWILSFAVVHSWMKPYRSHTLNILESLSLVIAALALVASVLILPLDDLTVASEGAQVLATVLIVGSNAFFIAAVIFAGVSESVLLARANNAKMQGTGGAMAATASVPAEGAGNATGPPAETGGGRPAIMMRQNSWFIDRPPSRESMAGVGGARNA